MTHRNSPPPYFHYTRHYPREYYRAHHRRESVFILYNPPAYPSSISPHTDRSCAGHLRRYLVMMYNQRCQLSKFKMREIFGGSELLLCRTFECSHRLASYLLWCLKKYYKAGDFCKMRESGRSGENAYVSRKMHVI